MIRIIVSPTRSGSTALLRCFENNPTVTKVYHQPVKSGYRQDGKFDYSFFSLDGETVGGIFVAKETLGGFVPPETEFSPVPHPIEMSVAERRFPSRSEIEKTRPLFLFRDPLQTWNSIHKLNQYSKGRSPYFSPLGFFLTSYRNCFDLMQFTRASSPSVSCLTLEHLALNPQRVIQNLCAKWNITYDDAMVNWQVPFGSKTVYSDETAYRMANDPRFKLSKESLERSFCFSYVAREVDIPNEERQRIEAEVQCYYEKAVVLSESDFP